MASVRTANVFVRIEPTQATIAKCVESLKQCVLVVFNCPPVLQHHACAICHDLKFDKHRISASHRKTIEEKQVRFNEFSHPSFILLVFGRAEVPCDRIVSPWIRENCSQTLFGEPVCERPTHSLIFHVQTQSCICRETMKKRPICFNDGLLIIDDKTNSTSCSWVVFEGVGKFYFLLIDARFRIRVHNASGIHVLITVETMGRARSME